MNKKEKLFALVFASFMIALEIIMAFTPIGYITTGAIEITLMHIPVIITGIVLKRKYGALLGFIFGLTSVLIATLRTPPTGFMFSPFLPQGNIGSLVIALVPRVLLGYLSGLTYELLENKVNSKLNAILTAVLNTFIHTVLVLGLIYFIFKNTPFFENTTVVALIWGTLTANGVYEIIIAGIIAALVNEVIIHYTKKNKKTCSI